MSKKNTPEKTRQRTLAFVAVFVGFLGTSVFAGINVFAAHQKNQDFSQLDAEEKFSRLPEYLLVDRKLLQDKSRIVRSIAAKALGDLQSKESIPELNLLMKGEFDFSQPNSVSCSAAESLGKLKAKTEISELISLIEHDSDTSCIARALDKMPVKDVISSLVARLDSSDGRVGSDILYGLPRKEVISQLNKLLERPNISIRFKIESLVNSLKDSSIEISNQNISIDYDTNKALGALKLKKSSISLRISSDSNIAVLRQVLCKQLMQTLPAKSPKSLRLFRLSQSCDRDFILHSIAESHEFKEAIPWLIDLLQSSDSSIRHSATHLLGKLQIKESIPQLLIALNNSTGIEQYKVLEALVNLDGLNEFHAKKWMLEMVKELEKFDAFSDSEKKTLAINISTKIHLRFNQEYKVNSSPMNQSRRIRDSQRILTGFALSAFSFLFLLTLFCLKELQRIVWEDYLICYFPEEVVSELSALRSELTQAKKSTLLVETTLLYVIFTLIWAFYIQINIDNLWLPSKDQRRR
jgi:HEAT repeat protein